jgi:hypothetical protein
MINMRWFEHHRSFVRITGFSYCVGDKFCTREPAYNDIGFHDTAPLATDILWYQLIPHC